MAGEPFEVSMNPPHKIIEFYRVIVCFNVFCREFRRQGFAVGAQDAVAEDAVRKVEKDAAGNSAVRSNVRLNRRHEVAKRRNHRGW